MSKKRPLGFWLLMLFAIFLLVMIIIGQTGALINYKLMVRLGLQESKDAVSALGVAMNKGFAAGDTIIYLPLLLLGIIGLLLKKAWGLVTMTAALGITAYWPMSCLFYMWFAKGLPSFNFGCFVSYTVILISITVLSLIGLFYLYKKCYKTQ